jgi:type II secretory pathway pseudopilin PulG
LVELLTVIAIIAVLAAIGMAGLSRTRQSARTASSLANLRSIAVAANIYAGEHQNRFPFLANNTPSGDYSGGAMGTTGILWTDAVLPYLAPKQTFSGANNTTFQQCPVFMDPLVENGSHNSLGDYGGSTQVFTQPYLNDEAVRRVPQISQPSKLVMVVTAEKMSGGAPNGIPTWYLDTGTATSGYVGNYGGRYNQPSDRGLGNVLCAFVDGHTASIPLTQFVADRASLLLNN